MDRYDPLTAPDPERWLALDEQARIALVRRWHEETGADQGEKPELHAGFHAVIENQIALNEPALVAVKLRQLMAQGLVRHDALHAIMSVLANRVFLNLKREDTGPFSLPLYEAGLRRLSARKWLPR